MKPTQEKAVQWAREASGVEFTTNIAGVRIGMSSEHLERFATLAYEAGRKDEAALQRLNKAAEESGEPL